MVLLLKTFFMLLYLLITKDNGTRYQMPKYDFKCMTCSEMVETNETIPPICGTCSGTMQRVWSAPAIKFTGTGFYSTDK